jgi:hypothetical protein
MSDKAVAAFEVIGYTETSLKWIEFLADKGDMAEIKEEIKRINEYKDKVLKKDE